jgi:hypothetical protein
MQFLAGKIVPDSSHYTVDHSHLVPFANVSLSSRSLSRDLVESGYLSASHTGQGSDSLVIFAYEYD